MKKLLCIAILTIAILINFHQIFFSVFAYSDSYDFLLNADNQYFFGRWLQSGRPLFGIGAQWIFTHLDISELVWVRCFSLIGMLAFSIMLFHISSKYYGNFIGFFIAVAVAFCPSMIITTIWTSTYQISLSLFLSLLAGWLLIKQIDQGLKFRHLLIPLLLSFIALNFYQPGYTAFIIPICLEFINKNKTHKQLAILLCIHLATYLIYFSLFKFSLNYYDIVPETRSGLNLNIFSSLKWLFKHPFKQALNLGFPFAPRWVLTTLTILICITIIYNGITYCGKEMAKIAYFLLGIMLLYVLSVLPNFMVVDHFVSYRMLTVIIILNIIMIAHTLHQVSNKKILNGLIIPFSLISVVAGYFNTNYALIDIQKKEYKIAASFFSQIDESITTVYILPPNNQFLVKSDYLRRTATDEFGMLSNSIPWVPKPFFQLLINKYNLNAKIEILESDGSKKISQNSIVFDCEKVWEKSE